jgi:hypothetical protein
MLPSISNDDKLSSKDFKELLNKDINYQLYKDSHVDNKDNNDKNKIITSIKSKDELLSPKKPETNPYNNLSNSYVSPIQRNMRLINPSIRSPLNNTNISTNYYNHSDKDIILRKIKQYQSDNYYIDSLHNNNNNNNNNNYSSPQSKHFEQFFPNLESINRIGKNQLKLVSPNKKINQFINSIRLYDSQLNNTNEINLSRPITNTVTDEMDDMDERNEIQIEKNEFKKDNNIRDNNTIHNYMEEINKLKLEIEQYKNIEKDLIIEKNQFSDDLEQEINRQKDHFNEEKEKLVR